MSNTTDTNQASELFELCKQVYEATGLADTIDYFYLKNNGDYNVDRASHTQVDHNWWKLGGEVPARCFPLYTSDYLLEKLPAHFYGGTIAMTAETDEGPTRYSFFYEDNHETAQVVHCENVRLQGWHDTPLKALLKLTISLSEAGEL